MDLNKWLEDMRAAILSLERLDLPYQKLPHMLGGPADPARLAALLAAVGVDLDATFVQFYRMCDGVDLPDGHIGYFIDPVEMMLRRREKGEPVRVSDQGTFPVLVFGSDRGGGRFALRLDHERGIVYLPSTGAVDDRTFDASMDPVLPLAPGFDQFLSRLLDDVRAFLRRDENWEYMAR